MTDKTYQTTLLIRGDSKNAVRSVQLTRDELDRLTGVQRKGTTVTQQFSAAFDKANTSVGNATRSFSGLQGLIGALGIGKLVSETIKAADTYASLQGQLKLVTGSQEELNAVYNEALALANATGQSTESTVNLYARLARSTEELGLSQDQLFTITEAINQSFVVSGASAQEASSAILQLSQGMASGVLRGEELNSVMENSPRLARAIAEGLGVTIGQLREMGKEGELTAEAVTSALLETADTIEDEFNDMPMTIGRVWQTLTNDVNDALGQVDTGPLIESVEEMRKVIADPAFKAGITDLAAALLSLVSNGAQAASTMAGLARFIGEELAASIGGIAADDIPRLEIQLAKLQKQLEFYSQPGRGSKSTIEELNEQIRQLESRLKTAYAITTDFTKSTAASGKAADDTGKSVKKSGEAATDYAKTIKEVEKSLKESNKTHEKSTRLFEEGHKILDDMVEKSEDYVRQLEFEVSLIGKTEREQAVLTAQRKLGAGATQELKDQTRAYTEELFDNKEAMKASEEATKAVAKAAEEMQQSWEESRDVLSDFFFEFAKDGNDAFDTLVEGFKAMIVKMIAEAAANQIILGIGTVAGGLGFSSVANAASSAAGGAAGGASGLSALAPGAYSYFAQNSSLFTNQGLQFAVPGDGGAALGPQFNFANAAYGVAGGLTGSYLGNRAFGDTTGVGSTIGAFAGTLIPGLGPFAGSAVGSFLGSGAERLLGNVLGFGGNGGNNAGRSTFNLATGQINTAGIGQNFDQANVDAAGGLTATLQQFAAILGGSNFSGAVKVGNRSGITMGGVNYRSPEEFFQATFDAIIDGATSLSGPLKELIRGFDGTAEQMMTFSAAVISLSDQAGINSVTQAIEDFNRVQPTMLEAYQDQTITMRTLITNFDGSAMAAEELALTLSANKSAAYEFAIAIQSIGKQLAETAAEQAQSIRESVMTDEELRRRRQFERDILQAQLPTMTNPEEVAEVTNRILELNRQLFDTLPEELRAERAEAFAAYAEWTGNVAQQVLDKSISDMQASQERINAQVSQMLNDTAARQQAAANTMQSAANNFANVVAILQSQGIRVNVSTGREVNV